MIVGENMNTSAKHLTDASPNSMLIKTKLNIPIIQQKLISRTHLDTELNDGLRYKLTLVTAPAGFGKTTAVVKWARRINIPAAWFSIDAYDNSLGVFWNYIITALDAVLPGIKNKFPQYFNTADSMAIHGIVTSLIDELIKLKNDFILVMDDYHLIEDISIHESLALLIRYLPENAHIVIISRSRLPFGSVRLQTTGFIKEITVSDLKFTGNEIADFCKEKGINISKDDIAVLESRTEGWAAGLYLILDSLKYNDNLSKLLSCFNMDSHRIASYLSEEVMEQWAEEEKEFMLKTSILSSLSGPLCDALTGRTDGRRFLERLSSHNAFIISMDSENVCYRYHHLYSEFLQNLLDRESPFLKTVLHERAGEWYQKNGYFREAIIHFLQSAKYDRAAAIIEQKGCEMLKSGDIKTLLGWFGCFPVSTIEDSDMLCLTYAWALGLSERINEATQWINTVESRCKSPAAEKADKIWTGQIETEVAAFRGVMGIRQENPQIILESITKFTDITFGESIFCSFGINFSTGEASLLAGMLGMKGHLNIIDKEYTGIYEKARNVITRYFGYIPVLMGELFFERNRIDEAVPLLVKGVHEAENTNTIGSFLPSIITLAKVMKSKGDIDSAFEIIEDGEKKLKYMGGIHMLPLFSAFKVRMCIEAGDYDTVEDWMGKNCLDIYDIPNKQKMYEHITLARALITRKDFNNSLLFLSRLLVFANKEQHLLYEIEILNLQAIIYLAIGKTQKAMETLNESLKLGEKEGYERIFIEEGIPMAALLGRFLRWNIKQESAGNSLVSPIYIRKLIKYTRDYCITIKTCMTGKAMSQNNITHINRPLTKREKDVLHLLDSELTNAEIAYTLDITLNTVKVNCTNIYRKLDVKNREQAVRRARELNILN